MSPKTTPEILELFSAAREVCRPPPGLGDPDSFRNGLVRLGMAVAVVEIRWRSEKVQHYLSLVDGLFGLRAVTALSDKVEAEIAGHHAVLWDTMTEEEQAEIERGIEALKEKWKVR